MVLKINEREPNPNPHINFICPLSCYNSEEQGQARSLLRALAAQVRPVMKDHGFSINSFEEYEHNSVFVGRNWNNGEIVELVLRGSNGTFLPVPMLISTLCHELAHIKYMDHSPSFQALWRRLRSEVRDLQRKGYYGDGYWSSGTRIGDARRVQGDGVESEYGFPKYMCGGAHSRKRPTAKRRRRATKKLEASNHTGPQTAKKRKPGSRVAAKGAFEGQGLKVNDSEDAVGTGFRKKASSKRAREERALAVERRIQALQAQAKSQSSTKPDEQPDKSEDEDEEEEEVIPETDSDRLRTLLQSEYADNVDEWNSWEWRNLDEDETASQANPQDSTSSKGKAKETSQVQTGAASSEDEVEIIACSFESSKPKPSATNDHKVKPTRGPGSGSQSGLGLGKLAKTEIQHRKKEALGLAPIKGGGRILGSRSAKRNDNRDVSVTHLASKEASWSCHVCTFINEPQHLACDACATART